MTAPRVLIVEDDEIIREFLFDALKMQGFAITAVADGAAALDYLARGETDLVLTDVHMPNMDGVELCLKIKAEHPEVPVVLMSGRPPEGQEGLIARSGAQAYLRKPIRIQHLYDVLITTVGSLDS